MEDGESPVTTAVHRVMAGVAHGGAVGPRPAGWPLHPGPPYRGLVGEPELPPLQGRATDRAGRVERARLRGEVGRPSLS